MSITPMTTTTRPYHAAMRKAHDTWRAVIAASNDADSHQQRTASWYALRARTLGGSEVATVLGECPYKNVRALLAEKIGLTQFSGNEATRWGTLFEPLTRRFMELILCLPYEIFEANSLPGCFASQRYSPDGLAVVRLLSAEDIYLLYRILFEFKAPLRSIPSPLGRIPAHYLAQVQCGLHSIESAHAAIFANNVYRRVALADLNAGPKYCEIYHTGKLLTGNPVAAGVIYFMCTMQKEQQTQQKEQQTQQKEQQTQQKEQQTQQKEQQTQQKEQQTQSTTTQTSVGSDSPIIKNKDQRPPTLWETWAQENATIDLGACSPQDFNRALAELDAGVHVEYGEPQLFQPAAALPIVETHQLHPEISTDVDLRDIHLRIADPACRAYLPWKLMLSDVVLNFREATWHERAAPKVIDFIARLTHLHDQNDPAAALEDMFADREAEKIVQAAVAELEEFMI